jgi:hypothetical protein
VTPQGGPRTLRAGGGPTTIRGMGDKDFARLRADANFKKLSAPHQALLIEACEVKTVVVNTQTGFTVPAPPVAEREFDCVLLCTDLVLFDEGVRDKILQKIKQDVRRLPTMVGMCDLPSFKEPRHNGAPAGGGDKLACQGRLVQIFSFLREQELSLGRSRAAKVILGNTIDWFFFMRVPIDFDGKAGKALAVYAPDTNRVTVFHESQLKLTADGIGDKKELLRKMTHEVNHACRRAAAQANLGPQANLADEVYAYVTELIADNNTVTEDQIDDMFVKLANPPYDLKAFIESDAGKKYKDSIQFQVPRKESTPSANPVVFPIPPGSGHAGWSHTNATDGK